MFCFSSAFWIYVSSTFLPASPLGAQYPLFPSLGILSSASGKALALSPDDLFFIPASQTLWCCPAVGPFRLLLVLISFKFLPPLFSSLPPSQSWRKCSTLESGCSNPPLCPSSRRDFSLSREQMNAFFPFWFSGRVAGSRRRPRPNPSRTASVFHMLSQGPPPGSPSKNAKRRIASQRLHLFRGFLMGGRPPSNRFFSLQFPVLLLPADNAACG